MPATHTPISHCSRPHPKNQQMKTLSNAETRSRILSSVGTMDKKRERSQYTINILVNNSNTRVHARFLASPSWRSQWVKSRGKETRYELQELICSRTLLTDLSLTGIKITKRRVERNNSPNASGSPDRTRRRLTAEKNSHGRTESPVPLIIALIAPLPGTAPFSGRYTVSGSISIH